MTFFNWKNIEKTSLQQRAPGDNPAAADRAVGSIIITDNRLNRTVSSISSRNGGPRDDDTSNVRAVSRVRTRSHVARREGRPGENDPTG